MGVDLLSLRPACIFADACNRAVCQQFAMDHVQRGRKDQIRVLVQHAFSRDGVDKKSSKQRGGNPFFEFHNVKYQTMKRTIAPKRVLSDEERRHIEAEIRKSWASIMDGPEYACWLARVRNKNRKVAVPIRD